MLFAKLHLHVEPAALCGDDDFARIEIALGEALTTFDSSDADVGAQIEVSRKFTLGHRNLKRPAACHGGYSMRTGQRDFHPGGAFIRNHPAGH